MVWSIFMIYAGFCNLFMLNFVTLLKCGDHYLLISFLCTTLSILQIFYIDLLFKFWTWLLILRYVYVLYQNFVNLHFSNLNGRRFIWFLTGHFLKLSINILPQQASWFGGVRWCWRHSDWSTFTNRFNFFLFSEICNDDGFPFQKTNMLKS